MKMLYCLIILLGVMIENVLPAVRVEKAICTIIDPEYVRLDLCVVKPNKNNVRGFSMTLSLLKGPLTNCHVNTQLFHVPAKRSVLLTNRTWDLCKHLQSGRGSIPALFIIGLLKEFSNLNHTCPLGDTLIIRELAPTAMAFPVPPGLFIFKMGFLADKAKRVEVDIYLKAF